MTTYWYDLALTRYGMYGPVKSLDPRGHVLRISFPIEDTIVPAVVKYARIDMYGVTEKQSLRRYAGSLVPTVFSIDEVSGNLEFVMESADYSLDKFPRSRFTALDAKLHASTSIAELALGLENEGKGHYDLCPHNILLFSSPSGTIRYSLTDLATSFSIFRFRTLALTKRRIFGHLGYIPPEYFRDEYFEPELSIDFPLKQDIFSFGMLLLFISQGDLPKLSLSLSSSDNKSRERHKQITRSGAYRNIILSFPLSTPSVFQELIYGCTDPDPRARPQSFKEIIQLLKSN